VKLQIERCAAKLIEVIGLPALGVEFEFVENKGKFVEAVDWFVAVVAAVVDSASVVCFKVTVQK